MPTEQEIEEVIEAIKNWRHWAGKHMLDALEVPELAERGGGHEDRDRRRLALARPDAVALMQEFFEIDGRDNTDDCWPELGLRLFVSHVANAVETILPLVDVLRNKGVVTFLAHREIGVGQVWRDKLLQALNEMDALLAVHSDGFSTSAWCGQEVGFALGRDTLVISVSDGEVPPGFLGAVQGGNWNPEAAELIAQTIFDQLANRECCRTKLGEAISRKFKFSLSYDNTHLRRKQLQQLVPLTDPAKRNVELGCLLNNQIGDVEDDNDLLSD